MTLRIASTQIEWPEGQAWRYDAQQDPYEVSTAVQLEELKLPDLEFDKGRIWFSPPPAFGSDKVGLGTDLNGAPLRRIRLVVIPNPKNPPGSLQVLGFYGTAAVAGGGGAAYAASTYSCVQCGETTVCGSRPCVRCKGTLTCS